MDGIHNGTAVAIAKTPHKGGGAVKVKRFVCEGIGKPLVGIAEKGRIAALSRGAKNRKTNTCQ
jgi:hypothetical protein